MTKRKTAILYESFYDAISDLDDVDFVVMMKAYCNYALNGEPPELKGVLLSMWKLILPIIDKNNQLYENGSKGGRPKNQAKTTQEPNQNQTKTKNNQTPKTPKPTPSNDEDVDEDVDEDKDLDEDVSISAASRKERENFLKVLLFEKNLQDPTKELLRFEAHYQKTGWIDANGNLIRNRLAALKAWTPDKDAIRLSLPSVRWWSKIYEPMGGDRLPMLEHFRGIAREGDTLHIMADNKALVGFMESNLEALREVVDRLFEEGLKVNYRVKN